MRPDSRTTPQILKHTFLVASLGKALTSAVRRRATPAKLVVLNKGLVAALARELAPGVTFDRVTGSGRLENVYIALVWNAGQGVSYGRQEREGADVVSSRSWGHRAINIKTGRVRTRDLAGLFAFAAQHRKCPPLLVCNPGEERAAYGAGIAGTAWKQSLMAGPPV